MVKHTQTICWLLPTNCLSVFDHFVGMVLMRLMNSTMIILINEFLVKMSKENKNKTFLLSNFNLLNNDIRPPANEFLNSLSSYFLSQILQLTRVNGNSKSLINICSNIALINIISGNLTATLSDHLQQFLTAPNGSSHQRCSK